MKIRTAQQIPLGSVQTPPRSLSRVRRYAIRWALLIGLVCASLPGSIEAAAIALVPQARNIFGFQTSGATDPFQIYQTANGWGVTFLEPATLGNPLNYKTSAGEGQLYYNFFNVLNRQFGSFNGWNIVGNAVSFSNGSIQVHTYSAIGTPDEVGADLDVEYKPKVGTNDPTGTAANPIHWIQVVATNNKITYDAMGNPQSNPGVNDNKVDVRRTNLTSPYYDQGFAADTRNFLDTSRRPDVEVENTWIAALFLASGPNNPGTAQNPATITVYNDSGILWGWQNFFFPNVDFQQFVADVRQDVFGQNQLGMDQINIGTDDNPQDSSAVSGR